MGKGCQNLTNGVLPMCAGMKRLYAKLFFMLFLFVLQFVLHFPPKVVLQNVIRKESLYVSYISLILLSYILYDKVFLIIYR